MASTIVSIITTIGGGISYLSRWSKNSALSEERRSNGYCLHLVVQASGIGQGGYRDTAGDREINSRRGMFFGGEKGYTFYHPDPSFTPEGKVEWLVRSEWKPSALDLGTAPIVSAGGAGYDGFFWRQLSGDKGGGDERPGFCKLCARDRML